MPESDMLDTVDDEADVLCVLSLNELENGFNNVIAVLGQADGDD